MHKNIFKKQYIYIQKKKKKKKDQYIEMHVEKYLFEIMKEYIYKKGSMKICVKCLHRKICSIMML